MGTPYSILVAIASYGTAQDHFLSRVVSEYRKLDMQCRVVVLCNVDKPVEGAEVLVGLPTSDPYSLPFAHRRLFAENVSNYDLFIYAEDDTLLTQRNIDAYLNLQRYLGEEEILGFLRSETSSSGAEYIVTLNHHFRWLPETVVQRDGELFAQLSNHHSGCFIATRKQLSRALSSGGFLVPPHSNPYGMLETAASDIYTQCGLRRLVNLSRIDDFIVPHLANKYYMRMGVSAEAFRVQVDALKEIGTRCDRWKGSLLVPQTVAPEFRWSKNLYDGADTALVEFVPKTVKRLLSVGAASGETEALLADHNINVCAAPVDAVFGAMLTQRGIQVVEGSLGSIVWQLRADKFDAILMADVLHLVEDPIGWLRELSRLLADDGTIIGSVPLVPNLLSLLRDIGRRRRAPLFPEHEVHGVRRVSRRSLGAWFRSAGMDLIRVVPECEKAESFQGNFAVRAFKGKLAYRLLFEASKKEG